ncbi:MAG: chromosomal replication initiator protein DnaA [Rhodothermales bacterium]
MDTSPDDVWNACLEIIRDNVTRQSFKTWFEPLRAVSLTSDDGIQKLTVQLPSRFYYEWLEEHYHSLLRKTVVKVLGADARLFYDIVIERDDVQRGYEGASMHLPARPEDEPSSDAERSSPPFPTTRYAEPDERSSPRPPLDASTPDGGLNPFVVPGVRTTRIESQLNGSYTFDRFIEGDCNRLARSASWAIAQQPGATSFNPFLIYGGVGLGKTHLIQAIGNYVRQQGNKSVLYVSSERFTSDFVQSIQHNRVNDFSTFYRNIDLLVIDDVQFFSGKEKTQEEFFHVFNALHQAGKQIVLSGDRPPREIEGIEERLLSRFQWGLTADLQQPELETRIAILNRKAEDDGIDLSHEIIEFIAHNVKSNIRELEGALIRLLAHATLHKREIDLPLAKDVLRDLIKETRINLTIEEIQRVTCEYFDISEDLVRAKTRKREIVQARQIAMYFSKQMTQHSLKTIGLHFGGRDHSTVIHSCQSVENQLETDPKFGEMLDEIRHKIELRSR